MPFPSDYLLSWFHFQSEFFFLLFWDLSFVIDLLSLPQIACVTATRLSGEPSVVPEIRVWVYKMQAAHFYLTTNHSFFTFFLKHFGFSALFFILLPLTTFIQHISPTCEMCFKVRPLFLCCFHLFSSLFPNHLILSQSTLHTQQPVAVPAMSGCLSSWLNRIAGAPEMMRLDTCKSATGSIDLVLALGCQSNVIGETLWAGEIGQPC